MKLDPATLGAAFVLLSGVLGVLLLFAWRLNRTVQALAWWGLAYCLVPFGMGFVSLGGTPGTLVLFVSNAVMALVYGALYAGCRAFNGRSRPAFAVLAGLMVWLVVFPFIYEQHSARLTVMAGVAGVYSALCAWELWRHARRHLLSQDVAIALLSTLTVFNFFRCALGFLTTAVDWIDVFSLRWSASMGLLMLLFIPALAFVFLSMAKELVEYDHKQAALIDPLTGIPNRRALFQNAADLIERSRGESVSCLLFDLDNFKSINDGYGHKTGDHVLAIFAHVLAAHSPSRTFGRMGGEEFAAIILADKAEAEALADDIRRSFAQRAETVLERRIDATVSVGCSTAVDATAEQLLHQADEALYRAKAGGRNAVATAL